MSAIGFAITPEDLREHARHGAADARRFETNAGSYLQWSVGEGVELWLQVNALNTLVGCNPHFSGQGRMDVAVIETACAEGRPLDGHCFGWAAPTDPANPYSGLHSFAADLPNFAYVDERILIPPVVTLQVAAFATAFESFPTETAFLESEWSQAYAVESGIYAWKQAEVDGLTHPEVDFSGRVLASERRVNPATEQEFHWLLVRTEAGTLDLVADIETTPRRPAAGTIVAGSFWLSAAVVSELPPAKAVSPFQRARDHA